MTVAEIHGLEFFLLLSGHSALSFFNRDKMSLTFPPLGLPGIFAVFVELDRENK